MITIKEKNIEELKNEWNNLINNEFLTYSQCYDWNVAIYKYHKELGLRKFLLGKLKYYALYDDNCLKMIIPIQHYKNEAYIIGKGFGQNYFDFIYGKDVKTIYFENAINYLKGLGIKTLKIPLLREKSCLYNYLINNCDIIQNRIKYVYNFDYNFDNFEQYFKSLSRQTRQNIRTSYNHTNKENKEIKIFTYDNVDEKLAKEILDFHTNRFNYKTISTSKKDLLRNFLKRIIIGKWLENKVVYNSMIDSGKHKLYTIYIGGELAAYYYGLLYPNTKLSFKHVCMNEKFKRYRPGYLLFMRIVQLETSIKTFDFTLGLHDYKFKLGCSEEMCHELFICLN